MICVRYEGRIFEAVSATLDLNDKRVSLNLANGDFIALPFPKGVVESSLFVEVGNKNRKGGRRNVKQNGE